MSKELYNQAIDALRQRVAAAGEGENPQRTPWDLMYEARLDSILDEYSIGLGTGESLEAVLEATAGGLLQAMMGALQVYALIKQPDLIRERVNERRHFFAAESAACVQAEMDGSDDTFWDDDDPDRADEYGDGDEDEDDYEEFGDESAW